MKTIRLQYLAKAPITNGLGLPGEHDNPDWPRYVRTTDIAGPRALRTDVFASQPPQIALQAPLQKNDIVACAAGATIGKSCLYESQDPACYAGFLVRFRAADGTDPRFISYWMQSKDYWAQIDQGAVRSTIDNFSASKYRALRAPHLPLEDQRRIAGFLDDRVARIDQIIAARQQQTSDLEEVKARLSYEAIRGAGATERKDSGLPWLGSIPVTWPVMTVTSQFQVELGKMLDEKRETGTNRIPYLRNTNVQWDMIDVSDLKEMDISSAERDRFTAIPGDLLICEGGQPGRAAIWQGGVKPLGFQKALHRARSRGRSLPEWLVECLRTAVRLEVFAIGTGQTTIAHLPNDQLRGTKFPFPDRSVQEKVLETLHAKQEQISLLEKSCVREIVLLHEYKQSLITAAVTGEFDVTTASTRIPE
ncbi:type I restriction-modification system specificity subunit [Luteococcus sediminum]